MAAVFCQLEVGGEERGVHCVLVPLRDERGKVCDGVRIEDCGHKLGLNGVDNGRIWFDDVRVPRENLLDRYAQVSEDGVYFSPIENENRRFFTMLGTLIQGRISVGGASISATKAALTIAVRHARPPAPVRPARLRRGDAAARLPRASAPPAAGPRPDVRAAFHAGGRGRRARPDLRRRRRDGRAVRRRAAGPARARVPRRGPEGDRDLARERDDPGVPRGVRRRRLPDREPLRRADGRHRGLHDVRRRQHRSCCSSSRSRS